MTLQLNQSLITREMTKKNDGRSVHSTFMYRMKCQQCPWTTTFYEASGSLHLKSHKMVCPLCKNNEIRWAKYLV